MKSESWRPSFQKLYLGLFYFALAFLFLRPDFLKFNFGEIQLSFTSVRNLLWPLFGLGLLSALWLRPKVQLKTALDWVFLLWIPVLFLSVAFSQHPELSWRSLGVVLCYVAFFYLVSATVKKPEQVRRLIGLGAVVSTVVCLIDLAYFVYVVSISPVAPIVEKFPFWPGKNMLGLLTVINASLAIGLLLTPGSASSKGKGVAAFILIVNLALLAVTFSRSAWLALAAVCATLLFLRPKIFVPLLAVALLAGIWLAPAGIKGRINSAADFSEANVKERLRIWTSAAQMIRDDPLTGVGLGCFYKEYRTKYKMKKVRLKWAGSHAHNLYLHVLAETGVAGLATLLLMFGVMLRQGWRRFRLDADPFLKGIRLGAWLALIGFLAYSMTDSTFNGRFTDASMFHINLVAMIVAALLVREDDRSLDHHRQFQYA